MREGIENMAEDKAENAEEKAPQPKWKERYLQLWNKYSKFLTTVKTKKKWTLGLKIKVKTIRQF